MPKTEKKRFYIDFIKRLLEQFFNIFGFVKYNASNKEAESCSLGLPSKGDYGGSPYPFC